MCDGVFKSGFFSFPIMADLLSNLESTLLLGESGRERVCDRERLTQWLVDTIATHTIDEFSEY